MTAVSLAPRLPPRHWIVTVNADLPGLHMKAGSVLAVRSPDRWGCDSLYQTVTGDIVRLQTLFNGTYWIITPDGQRNTVQRSDLEGLICGRVIDEAATLGHLMQKVRR